MKRIVCISAPSELGLRREEPETPSGVVRLPAALREAGLLRRMNAIDGATIDVPPYRHECDSDSGVRNLESIREFSLALAAAIEPVVRDGGLPLVLGGDCSILLGSMLALRRIGPRGLLFLDGHTDFYTPATSSTGGVAGMDLAIACGHGPERLTALDGYHPLVREDHVLHFGRRDLEESRQFGGSLNGTGVADWPLEKIRVTGVRKAAEEALAWFLEKDLDGVWIHIDADVLHDSIMPAVDSRQPDGMWYEELTTVLRTFLQAGVVTGIELAIFDPSKDPHGEIASSFAEAVAAAFDC